MYLPMRRIHGGGRGAMSFINTFKVTLAALVVLSISACAPPKAELKTSAQVLGEIEPHLRTSKPSGAGPFPTVLYLHGGSDSAWYDHPKEITAVLNDAGFATIFIDSYTGRGINGHSVRSGALLPAERAADLLIALDWAKKQPWVKQGSIGAIGYSHGAATILDALVLAPPKKPTGLTDVPSNALANLNAAVLFYPWCATDIMGIELNKFADEDWNIAVPILSVLPGDDQGSDAALCSAVMDRHIAKGLPVTRLDLPGVGHTFDQTHDDHGGVQPEYNATAKKTAYDATLAYFKKHLK